MAWGKKAWNPSHLQQAVAAQDPTAYAQAFTPFYRQEVPKLQAWLATQFSFSAEETRDLIQDSLLITYEQAWAGKVKNFEALGGYAQGILRNQALLRTRQKPFLPLNPETYELPDTGPVDPADDPVHRLLGYLARLGDKCRTTLKLWGEKASMQQIAHQLGYKNADVARQIKRRCLQQLIDLYLDDQTAKPDA